MNPPISVVVHGDKWHKKAIEEELRRICSYELRLMEGAPYEHYTFVIHLGEAAAGAGGVAMTGAASWGTMSAGRAERPIWPTKKPISMRVSPVTRRPPHQ